MEYIIYHNPRCSKSRNAKKLLEENAIAPRVKEYLKNPPTKEELSEVLKKLNLTAKEIIRTNEEEYKTLFKNKTFSNEEWVEVLVKHPKLIERPIIIHGNKAVVGRPPERCLELLP